MKPHSLHRTLIAACALATSVCLATPTTLDFEGQPDGTEIDGLYSAEGVELIATIITAGETLFEDEAPPHSGVNVILDEYGPIIGRFATPVSSLSAYITYTTRVSLYAFDIDQGLIGTSTSLYERNYVSTGNPPNELISFSSATPIKYIYILGDPNGASIVLDDLSFTPITNVPDAGATLCLLVLGLLGSLIFRRTLRRS